MQALDALPVANLSPADMRLKDEYERELEVARELPVSQTELSLLIHQPLGDESPADRVLRLPSVDQKLPREVVAGFEFSSVSLGRV